MPTASQGPSRAAAAALLLVLGAVLSPGPSAQTGTPEPPPTAAAAERWTTVFHGYAFLSSNEQGGESGGRDFGSENHLMVVAWRPWGGGSLSLHGTFTLEPATVPPQGSPLLFQRGETYRGVLLVDRQHPHDLFVELAAAWERPLSKNTALRAYLAPWGEPALGPTAYPHRPSASYNPTAPLAHHNQDSTHISADVLTAGLRLGRATVEGSAFHGREPDENRWNIDQGGLDSYSGRLTLRPGGGFTVQVSAGRRSHPEATEPGDQTRQTASIEYARARPGGFLAAALILGRNRLAEGPENGNGLEATWKFRERHILYGRAESVDRDRYELLNKTQRPGTVPPDRTIVRAFTAGYVRTLPLLEEAETGLGAGVTLYRFDSDLDSVYGSGPISFQVFLRFGLGAHGGMDHALMHH